VFPDPFRHNTYVYVTSFMLTGRYFVCFCDVDLRSISFMLLRK
jgi:hypothetical protein